jgi:hypothetical protein
LVVANDIASPQVDTLTVSLPTLGRVGLTSASVHVAWTAHDDIAVAQVEVQRRIGKQLWEALSVNEPGAVATTQFVGYGTVVRFRARAIDTSGNVGPWATTAQYRLRLVNDTNPRVEPTADWVQKFSGLALKGQYLRTRAPGASVTMTIRAVQIAVLGNRGPALGVSEIVFDDQSSATVSAAAPIRSFREVLFTGPSSTEAQRMTVTLTNEGNAGSGFELDAFLALTPEV